MNGAGRVKGNGTALDNGKRRWIINEIRTWDTRAKWFVERFGEYGACELYAIHPRLLREMTVDAIESHLDMDL
ncbi:MAG: hypothetical protein KKD99_12640, partial [Proteobacteria bacterium]|nr:hypothetical protein [Pseudomonadota bacterium]